MLEMASLAINISEITGVFVFIVFPCLIVVSAIIALIRVFLMPALVNSGEKKTKETIITKVLGKREHVAGAGLGVVSLYYLSFENSLELRVPKKTYKNVNPEDVVKLTYIGEKFEELSIVEKTDEKGAPSYTIGQFTDQSPI